MTAKKPPQTSSHKKKHMSFDEYMHKRFGSTSMKKKPQASSSSSKNPILISSSDSSLPMSSWSDTDSDITLAPTKTPENRPMRPFHAPEETAMLKAIKFKSVKLDAFLMTMHKSYVSGDCRCTVPYHAGVNYLAHLKGDTVRLHCAGQEFECKVKYSQYNYRLGQGWRTFFKEIGVWINDVLVFQPHIW